MPVVTYPVQDVEFEMQVAELYARQKALAAKEEYEEAGRCVAHLPLRRKQCWHVPHPYSTPSTHYCILLACVALCLVQCLRRSPRSPWLYPLLPR